MCNNCNPCNSSMVGSNNVKYDGPNLPCTGVKTCENLTIAFEKIDEQICALKAAVTQLQQEIHNNPNTTTTTTTNGGLTYNVDIYLSQKINTLAGGIALVASTDAGTTWNVLYNALGGFPANPTYLQTSASFSANSTIAFGIVTSTSFPEIGLTFGIGNLSGDFTSYCGKINPYFINNITSPQTLYINVEIISGIYVSCRP